LETGTFDVAVIANPTHLHIETALRCAQHGLHLFMEKPIDCKLKGLDDLIKTVNERELSTYVAYPLRFHPLVRSFKKRLNGRKILHARMICASYLPQWRSRQDYRKSYTCFKEKGGGVFLDMSHEMDMAENLFGPVLELRGKLSRVSGLTFDSEDCADVVLTHWSGTTNIHLNLFSFQPQRFVEVATTEGYLRADFTRSRIIEADREKLNFKEYEIDSDSMYINQLQYFFKNLGRQDMENNLHQASRLFIKMIQFREAQDYD
jgi:predicted dehydrogenase